MSENEDTSAAQGGGTEATTPSATSSGGQGGRGRGQSGRDRRQTNRGRGNRSSTMARSAGATFKGNTNGMNGNVFQCHGKSTDDKQQFLKTIGVLGEHINKTFTYPQDVSSVCTSFKIVSLVQPADLSEEDYKKMGKNKMIWEASIKTYMK
jgi:hypothetical protein